MNIFYFNSYLSIYIKWS